MEDYSSAFPIFVSRVNYLTISMLAVNSKHEALIQVQSNAVTGICKTKMQCCNYKAWIDEIGDSTACLVEVKEKEASLSAV